MTEAVVAKEYQYGDAPILVFCDHASNHIPARFTGLGVSDDVLNTHIGYDIGAGAVSQCVADRLRGTALLCQFSRLLIDANRDLSSKDLIPQTSDQIPIPGNNMLDAAARAERIEDYYKPYHQQLDEAVGRTAAQSEHAFIVSIHSFTPRMMGQTEMRPWQVGMLWNEDAASAQHTMQWLRDHTHWQVGDNEPYDARLFNYSIDVHVGVRKLKHLNFELRQDLISDDQGVVECAEVLVGAIRSAIQLARHSSGG